MYPIGLIDATPRVRLTDDSDFVGIVKEVRDYLDDVGEAGRLLEACPEHEMQRRDPLAI
jgi:hypothetical protein